MTSIPKVTLLCLFIFIIHQIANAEDQETKSDVKKPYKFGYEIQDDKGNVQHRHEQSDGEMQTGSYGYLDANGIFRKVIYVADKNGFRARLASNEPGVDERNKKLNEDKLKTNSSNNFNKVNSNKSYLDTNRPLFGKNVTKDNDQNTVKNDTKSWIENDLKLIKNDQPIFGLNQVYMQLVPNTKLDLDYPLSMNKKKNYLENLLNNTNKENQLNVISRNELAAASSNNEKSNNYQFRYHSVPKNQKYEPYKTKKIVENIYSNDNYPQNTPKKVYFEPEYIKPNNVPENYEILKNKPNQVYSPNIMQSYNYIEPQKEPMNISNYNLPNHQNNSFYKNYKYPTRYEYNEAKNNFNENLMNEIKNQDQNNESKKLKSYYVKPTNTFYSTDPDPPVVVPYVKPNPIYNTVPEEINYLSKPKPEYKNKLKYGQTRKMDYYPIKPKPYYNEKPTYPPYEYHFHMPSSYSNNKKLNLSNTPDNEYFIRKKPLVLEEYSPPLPSPKPYEQSTQGRSIDGTSSNSELISPKYLTGFTPVLAEKPKYNYHKLPIQNPYKEDKHLDKNKKLNVQLLNSGLISINELDNQIERDGTRYHPNLPYLKPKNNIEDNKHISTNDLIRYKEIERINPSSESSNENSIYPESRHFKNQLLSTNNYEIPSEDELMYEKYKSMIRSRLPSQNLIYNPNERIPTTKNYAYNISNNLKDELPSYNNDYSKNDYSKNDYTHHHSPNQIKNNYTQSTYFQETPVNSREDIPIFYSKYSLPESNEKIIEDDNDPDLYNPDGAVRYSIKKYLGKNLKNRRYFKPIQQPNYYPSSGNYEVIHPNRFKNGLINAKEEKKPNRLNLIEHNYLHNYAASASNPTINKFKFNLKALLPKMSKNNILPYGGINLEELEKPKVDLRKVIVKEKIPLFARESRNVKINKPNQEDQLMQLEALSRNNENDIFYQELNKTNLENLYNKLKPISLQTSSTTYGIGSMDNSTKNNIHFASNDLNQQLTPFYNSTTNNQNYINNYLPSMPKLNHFNTTNKKISYKIRKLIINRGSLFKNPNITEDYKFIHVPSKLIDKENDSKNFTILNKADDLISLNTIHKTIKPNDNNLIELANQKKIVKVFPLGRVAITDNFLSETKQIPKFLKNKNSS